MLLLWDCWHKLEVYEIFSWKYTLKVFENKICIIQFYESWKLLQMHLSLNKHCCIKRLLLSLLPLISLCLVSVCLRKAQEQDKKVVLAGCVPQAQPRMDYLKGLSIIGVRRATLHWATSTCISSLFVHSGLKFRLFTSNLSFR